jgi:menaquinone-dependent protoporphyrinogen oxidase
MAKILVVYATVEGQTHKIARHVADVLTRRRHDVKLIDAADTGDDLDVAGFDAAVLTASVHFGRHHAAAAHLAAAHAEALNAIPSAFVSVSLHAMGGEPEDAEETAAYADAFAAQTGWRPRAVCHAAGAFRYSKYDFFKRIAARAVAKERGLSLKDDGDIELTDWPALDRFLDAFLKDHVPGG